jgi:hypothetical protein
MDGAGAEHESLCSLHAHQQVGVHLRACACARVRGGTRIFVTTAVVENLRVFFIEPKNGFFATPTVYGR